MRYAFYITNHGYGHASRNVPIIKEIIKKDENAEIIVKTDVIRCNFLKRNLKGFSNYINYYDQYEECGLVLFPGTMTPDIIMMRQKIEEDIIRWDDLIAKEIIFLRNDRIDVVISDVVAWVLKAARIANVCSLLISNFTWAQMYSSFYEGDIYKKYLECYQMADKAVWYEIHDKMLEEYCDNFECVSMISRDADKEEVARIKSRHQRGIVFVSLGGSADIDKEIDVSSLPYDFITTTGLKLVGENVYKLANDMINTPDYIAASDYVISKGGWSTVAEILLQRKKCALLFRGNNLEDNNTRQVIEKGNLGVGIEGDKLSDIQGILDKIKELNPLTYDMYYDDRDKISNIIIGLAKK